MKRINKLRNRLAELKLVTRGLLSNKHPVLAHVIPMRRCNLACAYCNEYDKTSAPVPTEVMFERIDKLAALGTSIITISGGEPLLHPELDQIIARIRQHGMVAGLISNGYFMMPDRIKRLNQAGLMYLQISIDNLKPDEVSQKSLKVLDKKLQYLKEHAEFHVNINSVLGGGTKNPEDALVVAKRAVELGFTNTVGVIHDGTGRLKPLGPVETRIYQEIKNLSKSRYVFRYARLNTFQDNLAKGIANNWRCRAGARYLYICEDGLVHYCSQQRGYPAVPLAKYTLKDVRREYYTEKSCAPYCTVSCVHQVSRLDTLRGPQRSSTARGLEPAPSVEEV